METLREPVHDERVDPQPLPVSTSSFDFSWFTTERVMRIVEVTVVVLATGFVLGQLGLGNILTGHHARGRRHGRSRVGSRLSSRPSAETTVG